MVITLIRAIILYLIVIFALRIMGKRQIGELQPEELVITIMISECAAAPLQDLDRPIINGIIAIFTLVILEVLLSFLTLKLPWLQKMIDGKPTVIIKDGKILQNALKNMRLTVEDLTNNLRQKGFFRLEDIAYCIVETDGKLSIFPTPQATPVTAETVGNIGKDTGLPCVVIADGRIQKQSLSLCDMTEQEIKTILKKEKTPIKDVFILTADKSKHYTLVRKDSIT
jgi:uncharacterized membrane protein YcaP (DUF421 family)